MDLVDRGERLDRKAIGDADSAVPDAAVDQRDPGFDRPCRDHVAGIEQAIEHREDLTAGMHGPMSCLTPSVWSLRSATVTSANAPCSEASER